MRVNLFAVVGMHRSGTSIVSRLLNLLGADLGPERDLMPPKPDNPRGFWEALSVTRIHDDLLAHLGGRWDRPVLKPPDWEHGTDLEPFVDRIRGVVASHFEGARVAAWKDPRGSLCLPLWRQVVPIAGTVLCVRDPRDVARSLAKRDGLAPEHVAGLWLAYTLSAYLGDASQRVVTFEQAEQAPLELACRLSEYADLPPPAGLVARAIEAFVDGARAKAQRERDGDGDGHAAEGPAMRLAIATNDLVTTKDRAVVVPVARALVASFRKDGIPGLPEG
jgi:hypothetical protein